MPNAYEIKDQTILETPILLFDCTLPGGAVERWSTHQVTFDGQVYAPRVLVHNAFDMRSSGEDGIESVNRVAVTLANADGHFSQLERNGGIKGARLQLRFVFFDLKAGTPASDPVMLFRGAANPPDELNEATARLSFMNRLSPQRLLMPNVRIQKRCPWLFPSSAAEREEATTGGDRGKYSPVFRCGYSPDQPNGVGNLNGSGAPFTTCDYTRASCEERGMFAKDSAARPTGRFGGLGFVPASVLVRGTGDSGYRVSEPVENEARYNDFVPMVYGTSWYEPPIVFARNDGNLTRMQVLLGLGEIQGVTKVLVNDVEIPLGENGRNMTATGWYNVVSLGNRSGGFDLNFSSGGQPLGDPYGSVAYLAVVVPNRVSDGRRLPRVKVLVEGLKVSRFDTDANYVDEAFTANPAWVILDLLRRAGWDHDELDLVSFARVAEHCSELINAFDLHGNAIQIPRYQVNLVLRRRRSLADILRGVRNAAGLQIGYGPQGTLQLKAESKLSITHPMKPAGSNATAALYGGWPAYEFGDGTNGTTGLLRRENGQPALRFWSRSTADSPNRFSTEFQDAFNEFQQDSLSLVDAEDVRRVGQEIAAQYNALGLPNFDQAARVLRVQLDKSLRGNSYVEFESSVRALGVRPGDLITLTYAKEGFERRLFRVLQVSPRESYATVVITAQAHDEDWYLQSAEAAFGGRRETSAGLGLPRPLGGTVLDVEGVPQFAVTETLGEGVARLRVEFVPPAKPVSSGASIPLVGLTPEIATTGGTLPGGTSYYYAVSALDAEGNESRLSFLMRATIPQGTNTNTVTLRSLSFSPASVSFVVYRGPNPQQLQRIATGVALAATFVDDGLTAELITPPDQNFHEANFYWRPETLPEVQANIVSPTTIGNDTLGMPVNAYAGLEVRITRGRGAGQERRIQANSADAVAVTPPWDIVPDTTSRFAIVSTGWRFAVSSATSPVEFDVQAFGGTTLQITGRSANVNGQECAPELSPVTRWLVGGSSGGGDTGLPPPPSFGIASYGEGQLVIGALGFPTLENTRTITAGTLRLHYWNELDSPTPHALASQLPPGDTELTLTSPVPADQVNQVLANLIQIDTELLRVTQISADRLTYTVERGVNDSLVTLHELGAKVFHLQNRIAVMPFFKDFFGSAASGDLAFPLALADVRVAGGDLFVTNSVGDSPLESVAFTATVDYGLRTMSGGQLTLQYDGVLAIGSNLTPPLVAERDQAIREVRAVVNEAPEGGNIEMRLLRDGVPYADIEIPSGSDHSSAVNCFDFPPLKQGELITLDILSVPPSSAGTPGRDLTVVLLR